MKIAAIEKRDISHWGTVEKNGKIYVRFSAQSALPSKKKQNFREMRQHCCVSFSFPHNTSQLPYTLPLLPTALKLFTAPSLRLSPVLLLPVPPFRRQCLSKLFLSDSPVLIPVQGCYEGDHLPLTRPNPVLLQEVPHLPDCQVPVSVSV